MAPRPNPISLLKRKAEKEQEKKNKIADLQNKQKKCRILKSIIWA